MKRLIIHLQRCLFKHSCVIVPHLGAFIIEKNNFNVDSATKYLYPTSSQLLFNADLNASDGILAKSYMDLYGISFRKASLMLEEDINDLLQHLQQQPSIQLGVLGRLSKGTSGSSPRFEANNKHPFNTKTFGLEKILPLPKLVSDVSGIHAVDDNKIYIPINVKILKLTSAAMLILGLLCFLPYNSVDRNVKEYQAGFVPTSLQKDIPKDESEVKKLQYSDDTTSLIQQQGNQNTYNLKNSDTPSTQNKKLAGLPYSEEFESGTYLVVIASLANKAQAETFILERKLSDSDCGVEKIGKRYHIYKGKYTNKHEAYAKLNSITKDIEYADAWIYKIK